MIYVCIPTFDEAGTIGPLLWKIRQVFAGFPREYQLLVANDASSDPTAEILAPYAKVLPLVLLHHEARRGYAATAEELLRLALERTDRPRRDCAILMQADFTHPPEALPELVKRIERGADLVVAEPTIRGQPSRGVLWLRRGASAFLRRRVRVPGVRDVVAGFLAVRLSTLKAALPSGSGRLLTAEGWVANAELLGRTAPFARRVESVDVFERHDLRPRASRIDPWRAVRQIWRERRRLDDLPRPRPPAPAQARQAPEAAS
ncbi:MAG TPA: glycosyltransferase family 2 protein [Gemmatimonadales bacterium]|nr:glycosyltransferase family 2 protein [Gemmatimonadales bacterium]